MILIPEIDAPYRLERLDESNSDYLRMRGMVEKARRVQLRVISVHRIKNAKIKQNYEETKENKKNQYADLQEEYLLHGTDWSKVQSICTSNLDPSYGQDHEFGNVVYLSESSAHASSYPSGMVPGVERCMIGCRVLIGKALNIEQVPNALERQNNNIGDFDTKFKQFIGHNGMVNFQYGIAAKWTPNDIHPEFLISYIQTS